MQLWLEGIVATPPPPRSLGLEAEVDRRRVVVDVGLVLPGMGCHDARQFILKPSSVDAGIARDAYTVYKEGERDLYRFAEGLLRKLSPAGYERKPHENGMLYVPRPSTHLLALDTRKKSLSSLRKKVKLLEGLDDDGIERAIACGWKPRFNEMGGYLVYELFDANGLRLIGRDEEAIYKTILPELRASMDVRAVKEYVKEPKRNPENGEIYQAVHVVGLPKGSRFGAEVQVMTKEMCKTAAEDGYAGDKMRYFAPPARRIEQLALL